MSTSRKTTKKPIEATSFEQSITHLNTLIEKMESGELSLDASLKCFEEGITLIRQCQQTLSEAEQKVQILIGKSATDFNTDEK